MAVTAIWSVKGSVGKVLRYVANPAKTWKPNRKKKRKLRRRKKSRKGMSVGEILKSQIPQQKKYEKRK